MNMLCMLWQEWEGPEIACMMGGAAMHTCARLKDQLTQKKANNMLLGFFITLLLPSILYAADQVNLYLDLYKEIS